MEKCIAQVIARPRSRVGNRLLMRERGAQIPVAIFKTRRYSFRKTTIPVSVSDLMFAPAIIYILVHLLLEMRNTL